MALEGEPPDELRAGAWQLRALLPDDWELEQRLSLDPEVVRWTHYAADLSAEQAQERVAQSARRRRDGLSFRYAIVDAAGESAGTAGIAAGGDGGPEIFYAVLAHARRRGAATAAATGLAEWALRHGNPRVLLITVAGNDPSEDVAERSGFRQLHTADGDHRGDPAVLVTWVRDA